MFSTIYSIVITHTILPTFHLDSNVPFSEILFEFLVSIAESNSSNLDSIGAIEKYGSLEICFVHPDGKMEIQLTKAPLDG